MSDWGCSANPRMSASWCSTVLHSCASLGPGKKQRSFHRRLGLFVIGTARRTKLTRLISWISEDWLDIGSWNCGTTEIGQEAQREPLGKRKFRTWWQEARGRREHGIHGGRRNLSPIGNWVESHLSQYQRNKVCREIEKEPLVSFQLLLDGCQHHYWSLHSWKTCRLAVEKLQAGWKGR